MNLAWNLVPRSFRLFQVLCGADALPVRPSRFPRILHSFRRRLLSFLRPLQYRVVKLRLLYALRFIMPLKSRCKVSAAFHFLRYISVSGKATDRRPVPPVLAPAVNQQAIPVVLLDLGWALFGSLFVAGSEGIEGFLGGLFCLEIPGRIALLEGWGVVERGVGSFFFDFWFWWDLFNCGQPCFFLAKMFQDWLHLWK